MRTKIGKFKKTIEAGLSIAYTYRWPQCIVSMLKANTSMPIEWTKRENNNSGFPTSLAAENSALQRAGDISQKSVALNNDADNSKGEVS